MSWISPSPKLRVANFYATGITQDSEPGTVDLAGGTSSPYADTHRFTAAGLQVRPPQGFNEYQREQNPLARGIWRKLAPDGLGYVLDVRE